MRTAAVRYAGSAFAAVTAVLCSCILLRAQEKKEPPKVQPRVTLVSPLAVATGATSVVRIRGLGLADATAVRFTEHPGVKSVIKAKGKAETPQGLEARDVGDTQVELELTLPPEVSPGVLAFVVVTPSVETKPHALHALDAKTLVSEKEPNDGFRQAQVVATTGVIHGVVQSGEDVDVFRLDGRAGQTLTAEVVAARRGSALDSLLTLYDAAGHVLATNDDGGSGGAGNTQGDSLLRFRFPSDGPCLLAVTDANGRGGAAQPYLLSVDANQRP